MSEDKRPPIIELEEESSVKLTLEQRFGILHNIFKHQYFAVYREIGKRFGWQVANEISASVADDATPMLAAAYQRKFELNGEGAELVSQVLQAEFQGEGSEAKVVEEGPERAEIAVNCTFGHALQSKRFEDVPIATGSASRAAGSGCATSPPPSTPGSTPSATPGWATAPHAASTGSSPRAPSPRPRP